MHYVQVPKHGLEAGDGGAEQVLHPPQQPRPAAGQHQVPHRPQPPGADTPLAALSAGNNGSFISDG